MMVVLPEENIIRILTQSRVKSGSDVATGYKKLLLRQPLLFRIVPRIY